MHVLVAGVASSLGRLLAERLLANPAVTAVTGLDDRPCYPPVAGMRFVRAGYDQPDWWPYLDEVDGVVLLLPAQWPVPRRSRLSEAWMLSASQAVIRASAARRVRHLVVANNIALYGRTPPGAALDETAPVGGYTASAHARARARLSDFLDRMATIEYNGTLARLRLGWVAGPHHLEVVRHFRRLPALVCGYESRALPLVHEADAVTALEHAVCGRLEGIYHVAAPEGLPFRDLAAILGQARPCVPLAWATLRAGWGWRWRGWPTPPLWSRALYAGPGLDTTNLRAVGWRAHSSARAALVEAYEVWRSVG